MSFARACLMLVLLWAVVYLPGLGSQEIRGEEWRRVLPGRTMLNTGEWVVPQMGGKPYLRKPPLINWISAGSFAATGVQNEWTARLPSVLTVLGAALGMMAMLHGAVGINGALLGGVFFLGMAGVLEKGRMAELEVYYIAFTGLAFAAWLAGFMGAMGRWTGWVLAGVFLGLGMLIKGPVHLLFFYLLPMGAYWRTGRWRDLFSLPHLLAVLLYVGMFAAWAVPFMQIYGEMVGVKPTEVLKYWNDQIASRTSADSRTTLSDWILRGPEAMALFLPWVLVAPLWWKKKQMEAALGGDEGKQRIFTGLAWGALVGLVVMVAIPSSSPRYVAPLFGPVAMLAGWFVAGWWPTFAARVRMISIWRGIVLGLVTLVAVATVVFAVRLWGGVHEYMAIWAGLWSLVLLATGWAWLRREYRLNALAAWTVLAMGLGVMLVMMIDLRRHESLRTTGLAMRAAMGESTETLYVLGLGPLPYLFYLPENTVETDARKKLPESGVRWLLTDEKSYGEYRERFERDYGKAEVEEFIRTWGEKEKGKKMLLIRFAGQP